MITADVFDTKSYDHEPLQLAEAGGSIEWRFLKFRMTRDTVATARGAKAVCIFVNDHLDRPCLEVSYTTTLANQLAIYPRSGIVNPAADVLQRAPC